MHRDALGKGLSGAKWLVLLAAVRACLQARGAVGRHAGWGGALQDWVQALNVAVLALRVLCIGRA